MNRLRSGQLCQQITGVGFLLFLALLLCSHNSAINHGPFGWQPLALPAGLPAWRIGPLALLPLLVLLGWGLCWALALPNPPHSWQWGEKVVTLPLLAFTLLALSQMRTLSSLVWLLMLLLAWFIYLFRLNGRPFSNNQQQKLRPGFLIIVILVQSGVGIAQFIRQKSVGLAWLGELTFDLNEIGTSVTLHKGTNWLRAYGLNSHPNQFGLVLVVLLLLLLPWLAASQRHWRLRLSLATLVGLAGLLVSLSRSAWLAFAVGLLVYAAAWLKDQQATKQRPSLPRFQWALLSVSGIGLLLFAGVYGDTVRERFLRLDTPLESRSLSERQRDVQLALQLISDHPWQGVQLGNYLSRAQQVDPEAEMVHNVPLLISAEFGLPGLLIWLTFMIAPLSLLWRQARPGQTVPATAVWLAMLTISLVQPEPSLFLVKGAVLWGLAASLWTVTAVAEPLPGN